MDKEFKGLVIEIISLVLLLIIVVPICVNASSNYQEKKDVLLSGTGTSVDISHNGKMKKVTVYSNYDDVMMVNLILKIGRFSNEYKIYLDGESYDINDFDYIEDEEYRYYKLGVYEVDEVREFDFQLSPKNTSYYEEVITYSFVTEGLL